jgi:hypothetical protein
LRFHIILELRLIVDKIDIEKPFRSRAAFGFMYAMAACDSLGLEGLGDK